MAAQIKPQALIRSLFPKTNPTRRAPTYALIEVSDGQKSTFTSYLRTISKQFDSILVLWNSSEKIPRVSRKVRITPRSLDVSSRWDLLSESKDGFLLPLSLEKPVSNYYVTRMKRQLFALPLGSALGLMNVTLPSNRSGSLAIPKFAFPAPTLDLDYSIFDQRFWQLESHNFSSREPISAIISHASIHHLGLFAIASAECRCEFSKITEPLSRAHLLNDLLVSTNLSKTVGDDDLICIGEIWNRFGSKMPEELHINYRVKIMEFLDRLSNVEQDSRALEALLGVEIGL